MTPLQTTFYILGIIYLVINIFILLGIGVGLYVLIQKVKTLQDHIKEKTQYLEKMMKHPEEVAAEIGANIIRKSLNSIKNKFRSKNEEETLR